MSSPRDDLLYYILKRRIPLQQAIDILEKAKQEIEAKRRGKEKEIPPKYDTR